MELYKNQDVLVHCDANLNFANKATFIGDVQSTHAKIVQISEKEFSVILVSKFYNLRQLTVDNYDEALTCAYLLLQLHSNGELKRI